MVPGSGTRTGCSPKSLLKGHCLGTQLLDMLALGQALAVCGEGLSAESCSLVPPRVVDTSKPPQFPGVQRWLSLPGGHPSCTGCSCLTPLALRRVKVMGLLRDFWLGGLSPEYSASGRTP